MSSKLLPLDSQNDAQAITWRTVPGVPYSGAAPGAEYGPDLTEQARVVIAQQARIQELERELDGRSRQIYQQGYAAGEAAGNQAASQKVEPSIARLAQTVNELASLRRRIRAEAEQDAVKLSIAVARRILHRELTVDPESILGLVKAAFERLDARELHRVRLHPDDAAAVLKHLQSIGLPPRTEVVGDAALERGGAVFETSRGNLDASVSVQLQEIERGFIDLVRRQP